MNYIKRLEQDLVSAAAKLAAVRLELEAFQNFLQTAEKFKGTESDGGRKDWIATTDVITRLQEIKNLI